MNLIKDVGKVPLGYQLNMLSRNKFFLLLIAFNMSCATYPHKKFDEVQIGMDKDQVLDIVGSPLKSKMRGKKRVWIYRFYDENRNKQMREVQFENKKVIYTGKRITFDKIINANGSSYSEEDLEKFILDEKKKSEDNKVPKPDSHDMEREMLQDLKSNDKFVPIDN